MRCLLLLIFSCSFCGIAQFSERSSAKKDYGVKIGIPQVNTILLYNQENIENKIGFNGISAGFYYFYKKNNFIEFNGSFCATSNIPVPGPVTYVGKHELASALAFTLSNNYMTEMFNFGYGISMNNYNFLDAYRATGSDTTESFSTETNSLNLGIHLTGQLLFGKRFALALNYNPTVFRFENSAPWTYQHHIGLELLWRLKLKRK